MNRLPYLKEIHRVSLTTIYHTEKASPFLYDKVVNDLLASTTEAREEAQFRDSIIYMVMTWSP